MISINISKDFSSTPGARYIDDGPFSGEEFRKSFLEQPFSTDDDDIIEIVLDGTEGFATSFLEEAFGGLARNHGKTKCLNRLSFVSRDDDLLVKEILGYINAADR